MTAIKIVLAREDLSIPGVAKAAFGVSADAETRFFGLLRDGDPDAVVLDLSRDPAAGAATIRKVRLRCRVPILAVCDLSHPVVPEFRVAGAADCLSAPVDLLALNQRLQRIVRAARNEGRQRAAASEAFGFDGVTFYPQRDLLAAPNGATQRLGSSESRLLRHFVSRPWRLCPTAELGAVLHDSGRPADARAIGVAVSRLRGKFADLRGTTARRLIKTEPRRGYLLAAAVETAATGDAIDAATRGH
jgi:DNA-binding response OmpR family regulator